MKSQKLHRCTGCAKRFATWTEMRTHHAGCRPFIEKVSGFRGTRASLGRGAATGFVRPPKN